MRFSIVALLALSCASQPPQTAPLAAAPEPGSTEEHPYNRSEWGSWRDEDRDCQNTRQEVLIAESEIPVTLDDKGCKVLTGKWTCPFTGEVFTNPRSLDVDHMVPLRNAHESGGYAWPKERKRVYANNLTEAHHLIAVKASANRSKGARGPVDWLPPRKEYWCQYVSDWVRIKDSWELDLDCDEAQTTARILAECDG